MVKVSNAMDAESVVCSQYGKVIFSDFKTYKDGRYWIAKFGIDSASGKEEHVARIHANTGRITIK